MAAKSDSGAARNLTVSYFRRDAARVRRGFSAPGTSVARIFTMDSWEFRGTSTCDLTIDSKSWTAVVSAILTGWHEGLNAASTSAHPRMAHANTPASPPGGHLGQRHEASHSCRGSVVAAFVVRPRQLCREQTSLPCRAHRVRAQVAEGRECSRGHRITVPSIRVTVHFMADS